MPFSFNNALDESLWYQKWQSNSNCMNYECREKETHHSSFKVVLVVVVVFLVGMLDLRFPPHQSTAVSDERDP